jgi:signal transduction histidine kinase
MFIPNSTTRANLVEAGGRRRGARFEFSKMLQPGVFLLTAAPISGINRRSPEPRAFATGENLQAPEQMSSSVATQLARDPHYTGCTQYEAATVVRHLAHELRQPLSTIEATAYYLDIVLPRCEAKARIQVAKLQQLVDQANWILSDALHYLQAAAPRPELVDLDELIAMTNSDLPVSPAWIMHVRMTEPVALVRLDPAQGQHLMRSLLAVVRQIAQPENSVCISTNAEKDVVRLVICCAATDLPAEIAKSLFEPFSPHMPPGSGLALASVRRITEAHQGSIEITVDQRKGFELTLTLPRAADYPA